MYLLCKCEGIHFHLKSNCVACGMNLTPYRLIVHKVVIQVKRYFRTLDKMLHGYNSFQQKLLVFNSIIFHLDKKRNRRSSNF